MKTNIFLFLFMFIQFFQVYKVSAHDYKTTKEIRKRYSFKKYICRSLFFSDILFYGFTLFAIIGLNIFNQNSFNFFDLMYIFLFAFYIISNVQTYRQAEMNIEESTNKPESKSLALYRSITTLFSFLLLQLPAVLYTAVLLGRFINWR